MPSFGEKLKAEREKRSITLEQISLSTKIGTRMLQALEEDKFNQLPGGIFNKGFVRAYARCIGIDEDQAVADYLEASGDLAPLPSAIDSEAAPPKPSSARDSGPTRSQSPRELPWGLFAAALLAIALGLSLWSHRKRESSVAPPVATQQSTPAANADEGSPTAASANVENARRTHATPSETSAPASRQPSATPRSSTATQSSVVSRSSAAQPGEFTVLIQVREDSWTRITADDQTLVSGLLPGGTEHVIHGRKQVVIRAGNVGGVDFLFNGKKLPLQGEAGEVKTLTFGPDGLQPAAPPPPATQ